MRNWLILTDIQKIWLIYVWIIKAGLFFVVMIRKLDVDSIKAKIFIRPILGLLRPTNRPEISASQFFFDFFWMVTSEIFANFEKSKKICLVEICGRLVNRMGPKIRRMQILVFIESTFNFLIIKTKKNFVLII